MTVAGRAPVCLRCHEEGHLSRECPAPYCRFCKSFKHETHECDQRNSYANTLKISDKDVEAIQQVDEILRVKKDETKVKKPVKKNPIKSLVQQVYESSQSGGDESEVEAKEKVMEAVEEEEVDENEEEEKVIVNGEEKGESEDEREEKKVEEARSGVGVEDVERVLHSGTESERESDGSEGEQGLGGWPGVARLSEAGPVDFPRPGCSGLFVRVVGGHLSLYIL